ncbi:hypothetical protein J0X14_12105 [Muricauda sp. CAU 1633]|uniref:hypothetical protein n=1 Tax=Allomuricauda sp. CAU 1633 TaxID=2816036 RepID=UPI001A8FB360|nr:hypothetical protein [Muricauda sp. CAU 1633]MBO0323042.1 hypothetical protein [Muricauda sp. CAU 1633]
MTADYLKFELPGIYQAIFNEGMQKGKELESKRIKNWLVHIDQNKDEVLAGIKSGAELDNTESEEMALRNSIKKHLATL